MGSLIPFEVDHLEALDEKIFMHAHRVNYEAAEGDEWNKSIVHDGEIIACGGIIPTWPNNVTRGVAWALLHQHRPELFILVHKAALRIFEESPYKRIESITDPTFHAATRWNKLLGLKIETPWKPFYLPDGRGAQEWVRIK